MLKGRDIREGGGRGGKERGKGGRGRKRGEKRREELTSLRLSVKVVVT